MKDEKQVYKALITMIIIVVILIIAIFTLLLSDNSDKENNEISSDMVKIERTEAKEEKSEDKKTEDVIIDSAKIDYEDIGINVSNVEEYFDINVSTGNGMLSYSISLKDNVPKVYIPDNVQITCSLDTISGNLSEFRTFYISNTKEIKGSIDYHYDFSKDALRLLGITAADGRLTTEEATDLSEDNDVVYSNNNVNVLKDNSEEGFTIDEEEELVLNDEEDTQEDIQEDNEDVTNEDEEEDLDEESEEDAEYELEAFELIENSKLDSITLTKENFLNYYSVSITHYPTYQDDKGTRQVVMIDVRLKPDYQQLYRQSTAVNIVYGYKDGIAEHAAKSIQSNESWLEMREYRLTDNITDVNSSQIIYEVGGELIPIDGG